MTPDANTAPGPGWDTYPDTWAAFDALNRPVAEHDTTGAPRAGKYVGVFYYLWHGQHGTDLYDISKIEAQDPPPWGPVFYPHYHSEPLYGYYRADDEWVLRKNAQMLADAGVDVVIFDVTNAVTYHPIYLKLCRVYTAIRQAGGRTPQIAFLTWTSSGETVQRLYDEFYGKGEYQELWFQWHGKPLILARPAELTPALADFFTVRSSWAWDPGQDKWPWVESSPQQGGWTTSPQVLEQMVAATAHHPVSNQGKSFSRGLSPMPGAYRSEQGIFFAEQLARALKADPEFLFLTQWNEWIAGRFLAEEDGDYAGRRIKAGESRFVDLYSPEFNRDMEPMKGGYQDNYYYQLADAVRRFKGTRPPPAVSGPVTISLERFDQWAAVRPEYRDDVGDVYHRDAIGMAALRYVNTTGRNDFKILKVARSEEAYYFYAETVAAITPKSGAGWMNLFLRIEGANTPHWNWFQYRVGPEGNAADAPLLLERCAGGWNWERVAAVDHCVEGNRLAIRVPRAALRELPASLDSALSFKWADNMQAGDATEWILNGDTAPNGRFRYRYHPAPAR